MFEYRNKKSKTFRFFPSLSETVNINPNYNMFTEDISRGIIPISGHSDKHPNFEIILEGDKDNYDQVKNILLSLSRFKNRDLKEITCDSINNIAIHLSWSGRATYEIVFESESSFRIFLSFFPNSNLYKLFNRYIQLIPKEDAKNLKKRLVILNKKEVWEIKMPAQLGGYKGYKRIKNHLVKYDYLSPKFWHKKLSSSIDASGFNFKNYSRNVEIYYHRLSNQWGWNQRDYSLKNKTEFYVVYRQLQSRYTKAVLREHILNELNHLFFRLGLNVKIILTGLPTSIQISNVLNDLIDGQIDLSDKLFDRVSV